MAYRISYSKYNPKAKKKKPSYFEGGFPPMPEVKGIGLEGMPTMGDYSSTMPKIEGVDIPESGGGMPSGLIGAGIGAVGAIGDMISGNSEGKDTVSTVGSTLGGAGKGAGMGMLLGPWGAAAGAVIGGTVGFFKAKKENETRMAARQAGAEQDKEVAINRGQQINNFYDNTGTGVQSFAEGGIVDSNVNPISGGTVNPISDNAVEFKALGEGTDTIEFQDFMGDDAETAKNTPEGLAIFSEDIKRLAVNKRGKLVRTKESFSDAHKKLEKQKTGDKAFDAFIDDHKVPQLFQEQESQKEETMALPTKGFAKGGYINGGDPYKKFNRTSKKLARVNARGLGKSGNSFQRNAKKGFDLQEKLKRLTSKTEGEAPIESFDLNLPFQGGSQIVTNMGEGDPTNPRTEMLKRKALAQQIVDRDNEIPYFNTDKRDEKTGMPVNSPRTIGGRGPIEGKEGFFTDEEGKEFSYITPPPAEMNRHGAPLASIDAYSQAIAAANPTANRGKEGYYGDRMEMANRKYLDNTTLPDQGDGINFQPPLPNNVNTGGGKKPFDPSNFDFNKFGDAVGTYGSDLANLFTTVPGKAPSKLIPPALLKRYNNKAELASIDRSVRGRAKTIDQNSAQASGAAGSSVFAQGLEAKNKSNAAINRINTGVDNRETAINTQIASTNIGMMNKDQDYELGRKLKGMEITSASLANMSEKYMSGRSEGKAMDLDSDKFKLLMDTYNQYGTADRAKSETTDKYLGKKKRAAKYGGLIKTRKRIA